MPAASLQPKKTPSTSALFCRRYSRYPSCPSRWSWPMQLTLWIPCCVRLQNEGVPREKIGWSSMTKHPKEGERLKKIVDTFPKLTITVLGDLVADEFVFGEISRVSREAPVLILKHRERTVVPGGGANAANNLADLGINVLPVGVVGDDEPGRLLMKYFRHKHIPVSGVLKDKGYTTVTKTRILAGMTHTARQQVVRVDREPVESPNSHQTRELYLAARNYAHASDALLVSDYGYGAATPAIVTALREKGKLGSVPIVLDSRYRMLQYVGVTAATPNEPEVEESLGIRIGQDWNKVIAA